MGRHRRRARRHADFSSRAGRASRTCRPTRCRARRACFRRSSTVADGRRSTCSTLGPPPGSTWCGIATATAADRRVGRRPIPALRRRPGCPAAAGHLLERGVSVVRRRGIDLSPVGRDDRPRLAPPAGGRRRPDQPGRLERLRARDRRRAPRSAELQRGDYVEALPGLLHDRARRRAARDLPVRLDPVPRTREALERLHAAMHEAGREEPLVFITTGRAPDDTGYALELERYPTGRHDVSACSTSTANGWSGGGDDQAPSLGFGG